MRNRKNIKNKLERIDRDVNIRSELRKVDREMKRLEEYKADLMKLQAMDKEFYALMDELQEGLEYMDLMREAICLTEEGQKIWDEAERKVDVALSLNELVEKLYE